jgi:mRNA-degrading endonuclease YafQ of YafQ-DinJ toxin-antitoxin module
MSKYKYNFTKNFERKSSKLFKKNQALRKRFYKTLYKILKDPFYKGLKTHKVNSSKWGEIYSSRITKDLRVLWDFSQNELIIIVIDIGGHEGSKAVY